MSFAQLDELGRKFMAHGDYSPEGLQRFAQENKLSMDEAKGLASMVEAFGMYSREVKPGERMEILKEGNEWNLPSGTIIKHDIQAGGFSVVTNPTHADRPVEGGESRPWGRC